MNHLRLIPKVKNLRPMAGYLEASAIVGINIPPVSINGDCVGAAKYLQTKIYEVMGIKPEINAGTDAGINVKMRICTDIGVVTCINANINTGTNGGVGIFNASGAVDTTSDVGSESYRLIVAPNGAEMRAPSTRGLFRAAATFTQLVINGISAGSPTRVRIPSVDITDWPDFPVRGFYHDVTRGRVPTLGSLKRLVDTLSFYKLNQLQLYVEHTFAFSKIPEFSAGKTPLTAADILELDGYCADRRVDLVPSLSVFGHLYELLRLPRFERLNELDIRASEAPRDLWDRMAHYTLNVSDPDSIELVKGMIEEYAPLFSSQFFNICCDETFDLGKGKNADRAQHEGAGRLYAEFVNKIISVVRSVGKRPMLWGDIVLKHPEYISELPADTVFLNWDYLSDCGDASVKKFKDAGVTQYVCPGVQAWSRFAADVDMACANISRMARFGREAGAAGVLNTNWGDCGHVNLPAVSYHGLAFGAAHSWNGVAESAIDTNTADGVNAINTDSVDTINTNIVNNSAVSTDTANTTGTDTIDTVNAVNTDSINTNFDKRFSLLQWGLSGERGLRLGGLLRELGGLSSYHFGNLYAWIIDKRCLWYKEEEVVSADASALVSKAARAAEIKAELEAMAVDARGLFEAAQRGGGATPCNTRSEFAEYVWSADATAWLLSLLAAKKKYEYGQETGALPAEPKALIDDGKRLLERFKKLWLLGGRESELRDVADTFEAVFGRILTWS